MNIQIFEKEIKEYVDLITKIRVLSAVLIDDETDAEHYSQKLRADYKEIGMLGERCREILSNTIYPVLNQKEPVEKEYLNLLQNFCEMLLEPASGEELDLSLLFEVSDKLVKEFKETSDVGGYVRQLHIHINVCYANVNRTARIIVNPDICTFYRDEGLKAAEEIKKIFFDKELFLTLDYKTREQAMRAVRFYSALYDTFFAAKDTNVARYQALVDAIKICEDPFYIEAIPDYDWERCKYRCIEHMGQLTERGNRWQFSEEECLEICNWVSLLEKLWEDEPDRAASYIHEGHFRLILLRNKYFAGLIDKKEYQLQLLDLYDKWSNNLYDMHSVQTNLLVPAEYLLTLSGERISTRFQQWMRKLYDRVIEYVLNSANMDAFNYLQEYLIAFMESFIELPGVITFKDMGLNCLAAIHPPTYVHSLQVADISKCLAEYLLEKNPELFMQDFDFASVDEVEANASRILQYVYNGALCHDFGKIAMIDTIFVYGRKLFDSEFEIIKQHTNMGAAMLAYFGSTREYVDLAKQHHIWYDCSKGYPTVDKMRYPVCTSIISVADSIDAATDSIGRSYSQGKGLSDLLVEFEEASGTRYASYVVDILKDSNVLEDIEYLLDEGRQSNYMQTYFLLTGVKNRL